MDSDPPIIVREPPRPELLPQQQPAPTCQSLLDHVSAGQPDASDLPTQELVRWRWTHAPIWLLKQLWGMLCLGVLLAVVAAVPIIQLASLGYLLNSAANLARRRPWSAALPGRRLAGKVGVFVVLATLCWLPVWLITDLSYNAQLLQPGSARSVLWRLAACGSTLAWVTHVGWAAMRGGRVRDFFWPAPLRFFKEIFLRSTWSVASDQLANLVGTFKFPQLWWLGARATAGALLWTVVPVSMMIIGERAFDFRFAGVVGVLGAVGMLLITLYLPYLQVQMAVDNRFASVFSIRKIRRRFLFGPWAHAFALLLLCVLSIPLYLLRIEATPAELVWAPSLVFVLFMLPAKILVGAAMGYASGRQHDSTKAIRGWYLRWPARVVSLASALIYVGALYMAQLVAGQGALVMYFQHAFLVPAPLISS